MSSARPFYHYEDIEKTIFTSALESIFEDREEVELSHKIIGYRRNDVNHDIRNIVETIDKEFKEIVDEYKKKLEELQPKFEIPFNIINTNISELNAYPNEDYKQLGRSLYKLLDELYEKLLQFFQRHRYRFSFLYCLGKLPYDQTDISFPSNKFIDRVDYEYSQISLAVDEEADKYLLGDELQADLLLEFCNQLDCGENARKDWRDINKECLEEDCVNSMSGLTLSFSQAGRENAKKIYKYVCSILCDFFLKGKKADRDKLDDIFRYLFKERRIFEILVYKCVVDKLGLPAVLNPKRKELECDIIVLTRKEPLEFSVIEVTTGGLDNSERDEKRKNISEKFSMHDVIFIEKWLLHEFIHNPYIIFHNIKLILYNSKLNRMNQDTN